MTMTPQRAAEVVKPNARNRVAAATLLKDFPTSDAIKAEYLASITAMSEHWGRLDAIAELQRRAEQADRLQILWGDAVASALTDMKAKYR